MEISVKKEEEKLIDINPYIIQDILKSDELTKLAAYHLAKNSNPVLDQIEDIKPINETQEEQFLLEKNELRQLENIIEEKEQLIPIQNSPLQTYQRLNNNYLSQRLNYQNNSPAPINRGLEYTMRPRRLCYYRR